MIALSLLTLALINSIVYLLAFSLCQTAAPQTAQERRYEDEEQMRELSTRRRH